MNLLIEEETRKPKQQQDKQALQTLKTMKTLLSQIALPSAFSLKIDNGTSIGGTTKDEGMEESIASHYFKHGSAGLADVYCIGIKEVPSTSFSLPGTQIMGAGQEAAQALSNMLFPLETIRVTPIALFRQVPRIEHLTYLSTT